MWENQITGAPRAEKTFHTRFHGGTVHNGDGSEWRKRNRKCYSNFELIWLIAQSVRISRLVKTLVGYSVQINLNKEKIFTRVVKLKFRNKLILTYRLCLYSNSVGYECKHPHFVEHKEKKKEWNERRKKNHFHSFPTTNTPFAQNSSNPKRGQNHLCLRCSHQYLIVRMNMSKETECCLCTHYFGSVITFIYVILRSQGGQ